MSTLLREGVTLEGPANEPTLRLEDKQKQQNGKPLIVLEVTTVVGIVVVGLRWVTIDNGVGCSAVSLSNEQVVKLRDFLDTLV